METDSRLDIETLDHRSMLSPVALAMVLDVPVQTIYAWRSRGGGPPAHRVGRHLRFAPADVQAWLADRRDGQGEEVAAD
jgi:excisionase family DNA binding protein